MRPHVLLVDGGVCIMQPPVQLQVGVCRSQDVTKRKGLHQAPGGPLGGARTEQRVEGQPEGGKHV